MQLQYGRLQQCVRVFALKSVHHRIVTDCGGHNLLCFQLGENLAWISMVVRYLRTEPCFQGGWPGALPVWGQWPLLLAFGPLKDAFQKDSSDANLRWFLNTIFLEIFSKTHSPSSITDECFGKQINTRFISRSYNLLRLETTMKSTTSRDGWSPCKILQIRWFFGENIPVYIQMNTVRQCDWRTVRVQKM